MKLSLSAFFILLSACSLSAQTHPGKAQLAKTILADARMDTIEARARSKLFSIQKIKAVI